MSKKSRKRNKKILAALALAGGAAMLAKGRGKGAGAVTDVVNPNLSKASVAADVATDVAQDVGTTGSDVAQSRYLRKVGNEVISPGRTLVKRRNIPGYGTAVAPPGILNPYDPRVIGGRAQRKGGGIAKRGNGAAY
jgi:hypothetical protein